MNAILTNLHNVNVTKQQIAPLKIELVIYKYIVTCWILQVIFLDERYWTTIRTHFRIIFDLHNANFRFPFTSTVDFTFPFAEAAQAPGYPQSVVPMFTNILSSTNVDILAPQFYGSGMVPTSGSEGIFDFDTWTKLVPSTTKVMPIFKSKATSWSDIDADFKAQVAAAEAKCKREPNFCVFTKSGKY